MHVVPPFSSFRPRQAWAVDNPSGGRRKEYGLELQLFRSKMAKDVNIGNIRAEEITFLSVLQWFLKYVWGSH